MDAYRGQVSTAFCATWFPFTRTEMLYRAGDAPDSGGVHQATPRAAGQFGDAVQVVLVLEVPADSPELPTRAAELADEFGRMLTRLLPGVRAHQAVIDPPPAAWQHRETQLSAGSGLTIDVSRRLVTMDGAPLRFTYREFELLRYLCLAEGRTLSRSELMREVWRDLAPGISARISDRTVDTHAARLRAKFQHYGRALVTVRGRGYRFDAGPDVTVGTIPVSAALR